MKVYVGRLILAGAIAGLAACQPAPTPITLPTPAVRPTLTPLPTRPIPTATLAATATPVPLPATAAATESSLFAPVTEDDWRLGPDDASVTIVEHGDFQ